MLQYIVSGENGVEIVGTVEAALNNSCRWIRLDLSCLSSTERERVATIETVSRLCKNSDAILSIENDIELYKQLKVDGIHVADESMSLVDIRKELGEEPIMGLTIKEASQVPFLPRTAIDYVEIDKSVDDIKVHNEIVRQFRDAGIEEPVVAHFENTPTLEMLHNCGADGIALDSKTVSPDVLVDLINGLERLNQERIDSL